MLLLIACTAPADPPSANGPDDTGSATDTTHDDAWADLSAEIQAQVDDHLVPGFTVGVVVDGVLRYHAGFGVTNWGSDERVTDDTIFRWASVSKMHTAAALLRYADAGAIALDDPATTVLDDVPLAEPFHASDIHFRHLLDHTSALPDVLPWECDTSLSESLAAHTPELWAPPGSFYNYTNTGYTWIGATLERLSGKSFAETMKDSLLDPAGMTTATYDADIATDSPHADGATMRGDTPYTFRLKKWDCPASRPAGWLHGTATDIARTVEWQLADDGSILSSDSLAAMHAQVDTFTRPAGTLKYGMGQLTQDFDGVDLVWHDGWVTGFVTTWAMVPEAGFGVVIAANADWADPYTPMYDAVDNFLGLEHAAPLDGTTDPSTWDAFAGTYADPSLGSIVVTRTESTLRAEFVDAGVGADLTQIAERYFYGTLDGNTYFDVRFMGDEGQPASWFVQRTSVGTRSEEAPFRPTVSREHARAALYRYSFSTPPTPGRVRVTDGPAPGIGAAMR